MKTHILLALITSISCAYSADIPFGPDTIDPFTNKPLSEHMAKAINQKDFAARCFIALLDGVEGVCHAETALASLNSQPATAQQLRLFQWDPTMGTFRSIRTVQAGDPVPETLSPYWNKALYAAFKK